MSDPAVDGEKKSGEPHPREFPRVPALPYGGLSDRIGKIKSQLCQLDHDDAFFNLQAGKVTNELNELQAYLDWRAGR